MAASISGSHANRKLQQGFALPEKWVPACAGMTAAAMLLGGGENLVMPAEAGIHFELSRYPQAPAGLRPA